MAVNLNYATVAEVREQLGGKKREDDDLVIKFMINAAAQMINNILGHPYGFIAGTSATSKLYVGSGYFYQLIDECVEVTKLEVKESATDDDYDEWSSGDYLTASGSPRNPNFNDVPYTLLITDPTGDEDIFTRGDFYGNDWMRRGAPTVRVTAKWGYAETIPYDIKEATIAQVARWYKRSEASWQDIARRREEGQLKYADLDQDIQMMLMSTRYYTPQLARRF